MWWSCWFLSVSVPDWYVTNKMLEKLDNFVFSNGFSIF